MKRIGLLLSFVVAVALCAGAQQMMITFSDMPSVVAPTPLPDNYPTGTYLTWDDIYYVSPMLWSGAGPGFLSGPDARVAFLGGDMCKQTPAICSATIKIPVGPNATMSFQPINMVVAAGWYPNNVVVLAYNQGQFVGSMPLRLGTTAHIYNFPAHWTNVTQLTFIPSPISGAAKRPGQAGSMVIYAFTLGMHH